MKKLFNKLSKGLFNIVVGVIVTIIASYFLFCVLYWVGSLLTLPGLWLYEKIM